MKRVKLTPETFWARVQRGAPDACWPWQAFKDTTGYGKVGGHGRVWRAHRVAYAFTHGEPGALSVLHRCDNPSCCNPAHLFLGTQADNMRDMAVKGRSPHSKISEDTVVAARVLRLLGMSLSAVARHFNVSRAALRFRFAGVP